MLHFCMNWTPATPIGPRDAPFSSRTIPLSPFVATHTQTSLCDAKCYSATPLLSGDSALFHFPYPVSPVFATHTKTAGCVPTIPILELSVYHTSLILVLSFHALMNCPFSIPFVLTFMHRMGGVGGPPAFFLSPRVNGHGVTIPRAFLRRSEMSKRIRTWMALALVGAALVCGQTAMAQQNQDFSKVQIKVTRVSGNIYMLEGAGGNIGASVGEDGIVIVDDQFAPLADKIQAALKELRITDKPVRFVINTHYHGDHTGGNVPFNKAGSTLIAQDNVRKRLETGGTAGNGGSIKMDAMEKTTAQLPADVKVIPGHGALSNLDDVRAFTKMLKETSAVVQKALNDHKTLDQMKQEKILEPWREKWAPEKAFINADAFIETLYNSLSGHKGEFVKHN